MSIKVSSNWLKGGAAALVLAIAGVMGAHFEGQRTTSYADIGGVWSICYGHTEGVKPGDTASETQCEAYLKVDMQNAFNIVQACITHPLTVAQAAALTDATYNLGRQVVCGSTLQRLANAGDIEGACNQLTRWVHVSGKPDPVPGLVRRRTAERDLCLSGLK